MPDAAAAPAAPTPSQADGGQPKPAAPASPRAKENAVPAPSSSSDDRGPAGPAPAQANEGGAKQTNGPQVVAPDKAGPQQQQQQQQQQPQQLSPRVQMANATRPRGSTEGGVQLRGEKKKHKKINKLHPEFELTYDMMLGIRTSVSRVESRPMRDLTLDHFHEKLTLRFTSEGTTLTPAHQMRDFKFKDYAPEVFRQLRELFGITPEDYLLAVCGNFQFLEFISNSKSGQFFFYSHDGQYMIKTVSKAESKYLRQILPQYYHHISTNPDTLLTKFYGMHRVKPHKKKQTHFLIFGSVFHTSRFIHTTFDLKGSLQGRAATKEEKENNGVLKDQDFLESKTTLDLGPDLSKRFKAQIQSDVEFLRRLGIMDYSLLLGIHYSDRPQPPRGSAVLGAPPGDLVTKLESVEEKHADPPSMHRSNTSEEERNRRQSNYGRPREYDKVSRPDDINFVAPDFTPVEVQRAKKQHKRNNPSNSHSAMRPDPLWFRDDGGTRSIGPDGKPARAVYYMGIIDILTTYGTKKKFEHFGKSLKYNSKDISAVPPNQYAQRFCDFIFAAVR